MRKHLLTFLSLFLVISVDASSKIKNKKRQMPFSKKRPLIQEPTNINPISPDHRFGPIKYYSDRTSNWTATLIDSSYNGYGSFISNLIIAHNPDEGFIIGYRQYLPENITSSAGHIGATKSEDGEFWALQFKN